MLLHARQKRRWWLLVSMAALVLTSIVSIWRSSSDLKLLLSAGDDVSEEIYADVAPVVTYEGRDDDQKLPPPILGRSNLPDFPRIALVYGNGTTYARTGRRIKYPMTSSENMEKVWNGNGPVYRDFEKEWFTQCEPVEDIPVRPTCNSLHELGAMESWSSVTLLSMDGSWRSVWKAEDLVTKDRIVLKLLHLNLDFNLDSVRAHEMDSRVMERLTGSPRVVSSYGFCGQSVMTQFAESSGSAVIKDSSLKWRDRFSLAVELAQGLAELHSLQTMDWSRIVEKAIRKPDPTTYLQTTAQTFPSIFAHYDINVANTVSLGAKQVQWNDFNLGVFSQYHRDGSGPCALPVRYKGILWRSPEEIQNATGQIESLHPSDVYSFGTLLYTVFTKHQPWTHLEEGDGNPPEEVIAQKKQEGTLPNLPLKYQPERLEAKVIWEATKACFRQDPNDRPTAYRLALALSTALKWIQTRTGLTDEMIETIFR